jgi:hypothetical protein
MKERAAGCIMAQKPDLGSKYREMCTQRVNGSPGLNSEEAFTWLLLLPL